MVCEPHSIHSRGHKAQKGRDGGLIKKIHHVAIAVSDLDSAVATYREVLGVEPTIREYEPHNLRWAIFPLGESEIQLCQNIKPLVGPTTPNETPVSRRYHDFVRTHGEGLHHIALQVESVLETISGIKSKSVTIAGQPVTDSKPNIEPQARLVFLEAQGVNVEMIQIDD